MALEQLHHGVSHTVVAAEIVNSEDVGDGEVGRIVAQSRGRPTANHNRDDVAAGRAGLTHISFS
jgi:hypothetical protein